VVQAEEGFFGDGCVQLQAGAGVGDVLQVGQQMALPPGLIGPVDVNEVGAQHARFRATLLHTSP